LQLERAEEDRAAKGKPISGHDGVAGVAPMTMGWSARAVS
jgi:hypothetical protein